MKHLGSVTDINGGKIAPVDIISFGSPCQDLSQAGKRAGLAGERSGLFNEAVRIIREMQSATAGEYPRLAIWENVPGAFSSNKGRDFACVIESLVGAAVSVPEEGWPSAGVAFGPLGQLAWRVLDAQHFGVPQRRRRIFAVLDTAGERAGEILLKREGVSGDSAESGEAREGTAEGTGDGVKTTVWDISDRRAVCSEFVGKSNTLTARMGTGGNNVPLTMASKQGNNAVGYSLNYQNPVRVGYRVRRLTPTECERLQGFPDGWTDIEGASDTARYKALGNSVAIPCVSFIMRRIKEVLGLKTLGSLFDGIAGFPLAAQMHGITTLWASEIEPFCIRVSGKHFQGEAQ